jgi:CubicO group peptidase (beta-lactamase class C family)
MKGTTGVFLALLGTALVAAHARAEVTAGLPPTEQTRKLKGMIHSAMQRNRIVGMSAVVFSQGERLVCGGWGWEDAERRKPVTADSLFPLGSITKLFTATAVMQLVEQGAVDLEAPLSRYLPELAASGWYTTAPTVRQVLTHHGGLTGNLMEGFEQKSPDPRAFLRLPGQLAVQGPAGAPDTVFAYSNAGYGLLGCLVEKAAGTPYADAVTRGTLEPLGMTRTRFLLSEADARQSVMGFDGKKQRAIYPIRDVPAGALMSSAADMERFMRFIFDGGGHGVLGRDAFAEMTSRQNAHVALDGEFSIGLGYWLIRPFSTDDRFVSHGGDIPPFHALLVTVPGRRTGVFLAANSSGAASALIPLAVEMIRSLLGWQTGAPLHDPPMPPRARFEPSRLGDLPGLYASPMGLIEVRRQGERLLARLQGIPVELIARAGGCFTLELSLLGVLSIPLPQLKPLRLDLLRSGGRTYLRISALGVMAGVGERFEPQAISAAWAARAGSYGRIQQDPNADCRWPTNVRLLADRRKGLLLSYEFPGLRGSFPLEIVDDTHATIRGKGTGLGEAVTVREEAGTAVLEWSGMRFARR